MIFNNYIKVLLYFSNGRHFGRMWKILQFILGIINDRSMTIIKFNYQGYVIGSAKKN